MTKYIMMTVVLLLIFCVLPVAADDLYTEVEDAMVENVELSLLGGTVGWGAGAFWPVYEVEKLHVELGPFVAFGTELIAGGVGAKLNVSVPVVDNFVDFLGVGAAYKRDNVSLEVWVGKTIPIQN